uniref:U15-Saltitoxin-Pre1b_1 n=1 Tax=Phidippus regius TaxID=1905328 RepID=A0A482ZA95_9ARAC
MYRAIIVFAVAILVVSEVKSQIEEQCGLRRCRAGQCCVRDGILFEVTTAQKYQEEDNCVLQCLPSVVPVKMD